jgi:hypothetical protein
VVLVKLQLMDLLVSKEHLHAGSNNKWNNICSWNWLANGAGVSNTAGSITSTVSANTTSGFSIVSWTANGSEGATIGHGLGATPNIIISKRRSAIGDWLVGGSTVDTIGGGNNKLLLLNSTFAIDTNSEVIRQLAHLHFKLVMMRLCLQVAQLDFLLLR